MDMKSDLKTLIRYGKLIAGDKIVHRSTRPKKIVTAKINENGQIEFEDGFIFDTPTAAAKHASGSSTVNGWKYWKLIRTAEYLDVVRNDAVL